MEILMCTNQLSYTPTQVSLALMTADTLNNVISPDPALCPCWAEGPPKLTVLPDILSFNSGDYRSINQRFAIIYLCFSTLSRQRDTAALCLGSQRIINIRWGGLGVGGSRACSRRRGSRSSLHEPLCSGNSAELFAEQEWD